jgi:hypothetical protein
MFMPLKCISDYVLAPPSGSNVPGKIDANPYMNMPPKELRALVELEQNPEEKKKMISALKQFERQYTYPGYPWRAPRRDVKRVCTQFLKCSELVNPAINLPYYQDAETDQGTDEIIESLQGLYDNDNNERFNYQRQGIRPIVDIDTSEGAFLNPKESPIGGPVTKGQGDGPDPDGLEYPDPPTGGDIDAI